MPQKFIKDIFGDLTEVDAFLGVSDYDKICDVIDGVMKGERINAVGLPRGECGTDRVLTTSGYAYLKIADGCNIPVNVLVGRLTILSIKGKIRQESGNRYVLTE